MWTNWERAYQLQGSELQGSELQGSELGSDSIVA